MYFLVAKDMFVGERSVMSLEEGAWFEDLGAWPESERRVSCLSLR